MIYKTQLLLENSLQGPCRRPVSNQHAHNCNINRAQITVLEHHSNAPNICTASKIQYAIADESRIYIVSHTEFMLFKYLHCEI